jgi:hypothetical protein
VTTKTGGPSPATQSRVHAALLDAPQTTTQVADCLQLSAATVRKALTALKADGLAVQSDEDRTWIRTPEAQPVKATAAVKQRAKEIVEDDRRQERQPSKANTTKKATAAAKATKAAEPKPELTGAAKELAALGYPRRTAEIDGAVLDLIRSSGPLTEAQCREKLEHCPGWAFRRLAEGKHGELEFAPLIASEGKGAERTWKAAKPESVKVTK